jgi:hypothetical protein
LLSVINYERYFANNNCKRVYFCRDVVCRLWRSSWWWDCPCSVLLCLDMQVCNTPSDLSEYRHVAHWRGIRTCLIFLTKHMKSFHHSTPQRVQYWTEPGSYEKTLDCSDSSKKCSTYGNRRCCDSLNQCSKNNIQDLSHSYSGTVHTWRLGFDSGQRQDIFLVFCTASTLVLEPTRPHIQRAQSSPSSWSWPQTTIQWSRIVELYLHFPVRLCGMVLKLIKHRDSATNRNQYQESSFWGGGGGIMLTTTPPTLSRLSRKCGSFDATQHNKHPRPVTRIALILLTFTDSMCGN